MRIVNPETGSWEDDCGNGYRPTNVDSHGALWLAVQGVRWNGKNLRLESTGGISRC